MKNTSAFKKNRFRYCCPYLFPANFIYSQYHILKANFANIPYYFNRKSLGDGSIDESP